MAIQLVASLDLATVTELVKELTPLTINLGEGGDDSRRWMEVARPVSAKARYKDGELDGDARATLQNVRSRSARTKLVVDGQATVAWSKARIAEWSGILSGSLLGKRVRLEQGSRVFEAGGIRVDAQAETLDGAGRGRLTAKLGRVRARAGKLALQTEGELVGELVDSDLRRGTASTRFTGELKNVRVRAPDAALAARAKRAFVRARVDRYDEPRNGRRRFGSRLSLNAALHEVEMEQGAGQGRTTARADELVVSSSIASAANREIDAVLRASAQGFRADHCSTRFRGSPELHVSVKGLNQEEQRGQIHGELVVRAFSADDASNDTDCPWSRIGFGTLRADAELRGDAGARIHLAGDLSRVRLAWGDFSTAAADAFRNGLRRTVGSAHAP